MSTCLSGEENEEIIYCDNAELFCFDSVSKTWKERCIGELKLLRHSNSKKTRIIMRREFTLKVYANHFITADMKVSCKLENSAIWSAFDFSEEVLKIEIFAARFKTLRKAQYFQSVFENAILLVKECSNKVDYKDPVLSTSFKSWICDVCKVINKPDINICSNCSPPNIIKSDITHSCVSCSPLQTSLQNESQIQVKNCVAGDIVENSEDTSVKIAVKLKLSKLKSKRNMHRYHRHLTSPRKSQIKEDPLVWDMKTLLKGSQFNDEPLPKENSQSLQEASLNLVKILSMCDNFSISLSTLRQEHNYEQWEIKEIVDKYNSTFEWKYCILSLTPRICICRGHSESNFCTNKNKCPDLHICSKYIHKMCNSKDCFLGHSWETNHNQRILRAHSVDSLQNVTLNSLFLSMSLNENVMASNLQICMNYNLGICNSHSCNDLHFCLAFLANHCFLSQDNCQLCHSASNEVVVSILHRHGISVNESPKDIMHSIATCPLVKQRIQKFINDSVNPSAGLPPYNYAEGLGESRIKANFNNEGHEFHLHCNSLNDLKSTKKTVWSHYYLGNVEIGEICNNSVQGYCPLENSGCMLMHSHRKFHWQVCDKGGPWINLPDYQVLAIERSFCDPQMDTFDIPLLNPSKLNQDTMGLVTTLKGRCQWEANFQTMKLTLKVKNAFANETSLELRRLTVPYCNFLWYFSNQNKNWIEYGVADSIANENLASSINSSDIELHLTTNPNAPLRFQNSKFTYVLDVINLTQTNLKTNMVRNIRRRPKLDLNMGLTDEYITNDDWPTNWELMDATERSRRVTLVETSQEFQKVQALLNLKGEKLNTVKIERIQNIFLYRAFQNKVHEMSSVLKSKRDVDVQTLFHGTNPGNVVAICDENFDWRLHGNNVGHVYGKGTYFSPCPKLASKYASFDTHGHKFMFVAQVAVGAKVLGESSMSRPPINPKTNLPYDSTVSSISYPSVIVKFDKQEYYPEYLITLENKFWLPNNNF